MHLKKIALGLLFALAAAAVVAGDLSSPPSGILLAQAGGSGNPAVNENGFDSEAGRPGWKPGQRPGYRPRLYCVIDGDRFCRTAATRVGAVCRCSGMTGSGRVVTR